MKKNLLLILMSFAVIFAKAQNYPVITDNFFEKVAYVGAFGSEDWTKTWANFDCQNTVYPATNVNITGEITSDQHWTSDKTYLLQGFVYVASGATLTIDAGTVIRGERASMGSLIVEPGGKIIANGTVDKPIVFTSNEAAGSRKRGDWGGLIICGKAPLNQGTAQIEGGPRTTYGGNDPADNSGSLKYVRIEFAGYPFQPNKEINGLTFGAVGSGTTVDYVQVSYSNDDSYEWFGGNVNCKHLIAYRGLDDEFDTDFGYQGKCQFLVSLRDSAVADVSQSNGFESDNDGTGSDKMPKTAALFANVSFFGPKATLDNPINPLYKRAAHIRRNSALSLYNVLFAGYPVGLTIDGSKSYNNATLDTLKIYNSIVSGSNPTTFFSINNIGKDVIEGVDSITRLKNIRQWFLNPAKGNDTIASNDLLNITDPFNYAAPNFLPKANSVLLSKGYWAAKTVAIKGNNTVIKGYFSQLTATILPAYASQAVEWSSDEPGIATVDAATGKVKGISAGNAVITAKAKDGSGVKVSFAVTVINSGTASQPKISDEFFDKVSYIGAFGTEDWTKKWANFDCQNTAYPATNVNITGEITTDQNWTADKTYLLQGFVYVTSGATLTIDAGTVIRGERASMGSLIVEPGGKIIANGTADKPIVFTSNEAAGSRKRGDWGGLILCGKALLNQGTAQIEGGPRTYYGGNSDNDNSGSLKYIRIEFAGYPFQPNKEINGLTFGAVGSGTVVEYVQVSYSNDDSYEWFGGSVNCKYLIAYRGWDDEFDTDFGYHGKCQFLVSLRDSAVADISQSNGFESDNDGTGSDAMPKTSALFANVSFFGPKATTANPINPLYKRAAHIRRNSTISVYNTIFSGFPIGLTIDGSKTYKNMMGDTISINNSVISGCNPTTFFSINTVGKDVIEGVDSITRLNNVRQWFMDPKRGNDTLATNDMLNVTDPFNYATPNFLPKTGSFLLSKGYWAVSSIVINGGNLVQVGGTLQLSATVVPNYSVQDVDWSVDNAELATIDATGKVTAKASGEIVVTATAKDGSGVKGTLTITIGATDIGDIEFNDVTIYPNPMAEVLRISNASKVLKVSVSNLMGQVVLMTNNHKNTAITLNTGKLTKGIYFVNITDANGICKTIKVVKR